ncbi:MAG: endonuclease/exonuclease/phosphatase family protein, partial [Actinomycetota bacterium]|nr:endonuclease/exonuclease/phosphatase family protein [Actinomycetota bacterium]
PRPRIDYDYDLDHEVQALRDYPKRPDRSDRAIPPKRAGRLLLATWNIANLGLQKRRDKDYRLIAEILSWFDLVAIQEVTGRLAGLRGVLASLPDRYSVLFSDPGGNDERFTFLYDSEKVHPLEEVGEVTVPPSDLGAVKLPGIRKRFAGFDRNPYLATFQAGRLKLVLANVHLYFGKEEGRGPMDRRCLEAYAVARWADLRHRSRHAYTPNILALGDFNLPKREEGDRVYEGLTPAGPRPPAPLDQGWRLEPERRRALRPGRGVSRTPSEGHQEARHLRLRRRGVRRPLGSLEEGAVAVSVLRQVLPLRSPPAVG